MSLECILACEALLAPVARVRFDFEMNSFVSLEVVVAVKRMWANITLEGTIVGIHSVTLRARSRGGSVGKRAGTGSVV